MRVLVATTANTGHFEPLVPFARACVDAGHEVRVAAPAGFADSVSAAGFRHAPFDDAPPEELGAVFATLDAMPVDEANATVVREVFARIDTESGLPGLTATVERWRPDVVLRESAEFTSYLVAEAAGIPHVQLNTSLSCFLDFPAVAEEPLVALGGTPGLAGLRSAPRLTLIPASLDGVAVDGSRPPARFREETGQGAGQEAGQLPDWWGGRADPLVYVTFGTVAARIGLFPDLYDQVMSVLADLPVRVLLTTGSEGDPGALGTVPPNVHVERFWPQRAVMPHAAAMVAHGGLGTTMLALAHGVPMVLVPLFADQMFNADRVESLGAGLVARGGPEAAALLPDRLDTVVGDATARAAAGALADEIAALPPVSGAVALLEQAASTTMDG